MAAGDIAIRALTRLPLRIDSAPGTLPVKVATTAGGTVVNTNTARVDANLRRYSFQRFVVLGLNPLVPMTVPVNTVLPAISGTKTVGQTLTATTGTWTSLKTISGYTYQWKRAGVAISGATASTYLLVTADGTTTISVTVTATNDVGSASATSASTVAITP